MERKIKFISQVITWFDKVNGNTYHSCKITRIKDNKILVTGFDYGYGSCYEQTTRETMRKNNWIPKKYSDCLYLYERENNYPIKYIVSSGLKKECVANGVLN